MQPGLMVLHGHLASVFRAFRQTAARDDQGTIGIYYILFGSRLIVGGGHLPHGVFIR
jgi:hypothetical protein